MPDYVSPHKSGTGFNFQVGVPKSLKAYAKKLYGLTTGYIRAATRSEAADKAQVRAREVKAVFAWLQNASEADRAKFFDGGGLNGLKYRITHHAHPKALEYPVPLDYVYQDPDDGIVTTGRDIRLAMFEQNIQQKQEIVLLEKLQPVALVAEPARAYTFQGLYERWRGPGDDPKGWRVKRATARNYKRTAGRLAACFGNVDVRTLKRPDARKFKNWLQEKVNGTASRRGDLGHAFTLFDVLDSHELPDGNPFVDVKKLRREVGHVTKTKGAFSPDQLAALIRVAEKERFGYNRIGKRHRQAYWILKAMAYTGARPNEIANLRKGDFRKEAGINYLHIREDHAEKTVKGHKGTDNSRKVPLHSAIADDFIAFANSSETDFIFDVFGWTTDNGGRAWWVIDNLAAFMRKHAGEIGVGLVDGIDPKTRKPVKKVVDADKQELTLHRIRASFQIAAELAGLSAKAIDDIVGHKANTIRGKHYSKRLPLPVLAVEIEKVKPLG